MMLGVIITVGIIFTTCAAGAASKVVAPSIWSVDHWNVVGGVLVTLASAYTCARCALGDPGLLEPRPGSKPGRGEPIQHFPSSGSRECQVCQVVQKPRGTLHCEFCHVCIV